MYARINFCLKSRFVLHDISIGQVVVLVRLLGTGTATLKSVYIASRGRQTLSLSAIECRLHRTIQILTDTVCQ